MTLNIYFSGQDGSPPWQPRLRAASSRLALVVFHLLALHLMALHLLTLAQPVTEDQVKAAYLLNFAKAAQWPAAALPDGASPMVIGVSGGDDDFLAVLKAVVAGKVIGTHPLEARLVSSAEDMKSCHIVFVRASDKKRNRAVIESVTQAGVLFVGEDESFLGQGGMINLVRDHGSVRFEVNADALDRSQIHFSAKILTLAKAASAPFHTAPSNPPDEGPRPVKHRIEPGYPEIAERLKLTGTVQLEALVKPDGTVKEVRVLGGPPVLVDAVVQAVMHWKYQPASNETRETVKYSFGPR